MIRGDVLLEKLKDILDKFEGQMPSPETCDELYNDLYWLVQEFNDEEG